MNDSVEIQLLSDLKWNGNYYDIARRIIIIELMQSNESEDRK